MYPCTLGFNKTRKDRTALLFIYLRWGSSVQGNITAVSNTWVLDLLLGGAQQRGLTQGRGSGWRAPWQDYLPVQKYFLLDNLFPFICFNLSLDQAGSPLIISVIPLPNPGQQICFSKVSGPEINWKKRGGNPLLLMRLARALAGNSHQLWSLSSEAPNCTQQSMESFERESG